MSSFDFDFLCFSLGVIVFLHFWFPLVSPWFPLVSPFSSPFFHLFFTLFTFSPDFQKYTALDKRNQKPCNSPCMFTPAVPIISFEGECHMLFTFFHLIHFFFNFSHFSPFRSGALSKKKRNLWDYTVTYRQISLCAESKQQVARRKLKR